MTPNYPPGLIAVMKRIPEGWDKRIACQPGWWKLISDLNEKLAAIDPEYIVLQVKEKFGGLRFYAEHSTPREFDFSDPFFVAIREAELASATTCQICGSRDVLVVPDEELLPSTFLVCPRCADRMNNGTWYHG